MSRAWGRSGRLRVARAGGLLLACLLAACAVRPGKDYYEKLREREPPARHAVHDEHLREVMSSLERLAEERMPQELDMEAERREHVGEVSRLCLELAKTAERIPDVLAGVELDERQRREFHLLAQLLVDRSLALADDAPALSVSELRSRLEHLRTSCNECHQRFRVLPQVSLRSASPASRLLGGMK